MMIIGRKVGRLGNRLFLHAHLLAAAEEYGVELWNPAFAEYASLFPNTEKDLWCRYPVKAGLSVAPSGWKRRLAVQSIYWSGSLANRLGCDLPGIKVLRLGAEEHCDLGADEFATLVSERHVLLQGWLFRSEHLLTKHAEKVRRYFEIDSETQSRVKSRMTTIRSQADIVVGVHIRHGDYATYLDGKYYYPASHYASMMRRIAEQLSPRRVSFLVCGNGELHERDFRGLTVSCKDHGLLEDLYSFAEVDFLVGPPSTFTGWASFYGNVPLYWLESEADLPDVSEVLLEESALVA